LLAEYVQAILINSSTKLIASIAYHTASLIKGKKERKEAKVCL
jgi:hypothetical protein